MNVVLMRPGTTDDIRAQIIKAEQFADVCDAIVIVMQKKDGTVIGFINDGATIGGAAWIMERMKRRLHDMADKV